MDPFQHWAIVELMGHVRIAGLLTEEERFGTKLGRIDIPDGSGGFTTVYFSGGSVYRITPTTEEIAKTVAQSSQPQSSQPRPVSAWDLRALPSPTPAPHDDDEEDDD